MKDRVPLHPGRVQLTPVPGQENTYDMIRADEPTQEGTPLSKATFLKDATAALFGLGADAVPDDVFAEVYTKIAAGAKIATGSYVGTGTYGASNPCSLTFDFIPKVIWISEYWSSGTSSHLKVLYVNGFIKYSYDTSAYGDISINGQTISWYSTHEQYQYNSMSCEKYIYIAIG